jgi:hypothetical protein
LFTLSSAGRQRGLEENKKDSSIFRTAISKPFPPSLRAAKRGQTSVAMSGESKTPVHLR